MDGKDGTSVGFLSGVLGAVIGGVIGGPIGAVIGGGLGWDGFGQKEGDRSGARQQFYDCPHCGERLAYQGSGAWRCSGCDGVIVVERCFYCREVLIATDAGKYDCPTCGKAVHLLFCGTCGVVSCRDSAEAYCKQCGRRMSGQSAEMRTEYLVITCVSLGVAIAQGDGHVDPEELTAIRQFFREAFEFDEAGIAEVDRIIAETRTSHVPYTRIATEAAAELEEDDRRAVLEYLFRIALADGVYHPQEKTMLASIAGIFGFSADEFRAFEARLLTDGMLSLSEYCGILGVSPDDPPEVIKQRYRALVKEHHPDSRAGASEREKRNAAVRFSRIQEAYKGICKYRNM